MQYYIVLLWLNYYQRHHCEDTTGNNVTIPHQFILPSPSIPFGSTRNLSIKVRFDLSSLKHNTNKCPHGNSVQNQHYVHVNLSSCRLDTQPVGPLYTPQCNRTRSGSDDTSWARRWASSAWRDREDAASPGQNSHGQSFIE